MNRIDRMQDSGCDPCKRGAFARGWSLHLFANFCALKGHDISAQGRAQRRSRAASTWDQNPTRAPGGYMAAPAGRRGELLSTRLLEENHHSANAPMQVKVWLEWA